MTRDTRNNLIVATVAVSLIVHLGAMFWAKPKVMTHVVQGVTRLVHRGPMRVTEAREAPAPVAIEVVRDEAAPKDAPKAEETKAILPSDVAALPTMPVQAALPAAHMPEVVAALTPTPAVETFEVRVESEGGPQPATPEMSFDQPTMTREETAFSELPPSSAIHSAPVFEAPVFAPVGSFKERVEQPVAKIEKPEPTVPKEVFTPVKEVMPEIDEKIVKAEKAAVRDLVDSDRALDMRAAVDASLSTCVSGEHTYFRVTLRPKLRLPSVPKDVVVLIDASGSIGHDRLSSCRKAAREILRTAMNTGDRFNLVAFRDKFSYCFRVWQPCDASGYAAADRWMSKLAAHGRTDVFSTISSVLTLPREPTRPLVALVVTDGDANTGVSETAEILSKFTALNDGLISVYMYGVKSSANRALIDVLTYGNRGESFIFDGWRWKAGEGIGAFSERFRDPLITDLRVIFPVAATAEAYPVLLRNLYRNQSVELVGRMAGHPGEVAFSLRGIAGSLAYEGFFRLPVRTAAADPSLPAAWRAERALDGKLR